MLCLDHSCAFLRGEFLIKDWIANCDPFLCNDKNSAYKNIGNVLSATLSISAEIFGTENKYHFLKDSNCQRHIFNGADLTLNIGNVNKRNLYQALFSQEFIPDSGDIFVQDFSCIGQLQECDFFNFEKSGVDTGTVQALLLDSDGLPVSTLTLNVDYSVSVSGIEIINDSINMLTGITLRLIYSYDSNGFSEFEFMSLIPSPKSIFFKNTYIELEKNQFDFEAYKCVFNPISNFQLISQDDFSTLELTAKIEKDYTRNKWFKIKKQEQ